MSIEKLKEYKEKYEKELLLVQAKIQVVDDLIAEAELEAEAANEAVEPTTETVSNPADNATVY